MAINYPKRYDDDFLNTIKRLIDVANEIGMTVNDLVVDAQPRLVGEWDNAFEYETLSVVTHQGNSYTSKKSVPTGIDINNTEYWMSTGIYDAQIQHYRDDVREVLEEFEQIGETTFVRNPDGLTVSINSPQNIADFQRDADGMVLSITENKQDKSIKTHYTRDDNGVVKKINRELI